MARQARSQETIDSILDSALEVYASSKDRKLTTAALSKQSGVSVGSIYHHFGSLDGVAFALHARCMSRLLDHLIDALRDDPPAREGVTAFVRAYLEWTADHRDEALFIHAEAYEPAILQRRGQLMTQKQPRHDIMNHWLMTQVKAGHFIQLPPALYEPLIIGPLAAIAQRWLATPEEVDLTQALALLPDRIWATLAINP